jgi:quercetin dioxygenase-like cupin family protein
MRSDRGQVPDVSPDLPSYRGRFNPERHLVAFDIQPWEPMYSDDGELLVGIRGKSGASEVGYDGEEIGGDLIELSPGAAFPLHTHLGDHILYAISGTGTVTIDGAVHLFRAGSTFFIAGSHPHAVGTLPEAVEPFLILAVGHPQKHVQALDRMKVVHDADDQSQQTGNLAHLPDAL